MVTSLNQLLFQIILFTKVVLQTGHAKIYSCLARCTTKIFFMANSWIWNIRHLDGSRKLFNYLFKEHAAWTTGKASIFIGKVVMTALLRSGGMVR